MTRTIFFPFAEFWQFYLWFVAGVVAVLLLDLGILHKRTEEISFKQALRLSVLWVFLALAYSGWFYWFVRDHFLAHPEVLDPGVTAASKAADYYLQFLSGYLVEKALAVDNIFVFVVLFNFFGIPLKYQHRVLFYGILGALAFRAIFIAAGAVIMSIDWMLWIFGGILILTGFKLFFQDTEEIDLEGSRALKLLRKFIPITAGLRSNRFFVREQGVFMATPLFVALVVVELSDILFAFDSVPAIFALTDEPLIVFTSNIFAVLGLRAMYFLLASVVDKFHYLRFGLAIVLIFVGLKMAILNPMWDGHFPILPSLVFIVLAICASIWASVLFPKGGISDKGEGPPEIG
jgi:tellurite resistance protein TerC